MIVGALTIWLAMAGASWAQVAPFDAAPFDPAPFDTAPFDAAPFRTAPFDPAPFNAAPSNAAPFDVAQPTATPTPTTEPAMSGDERVVWAINATVGPKSLGAGVISAAWGVARDSPDEYGPNWAGFGKRYALRLSGVAIGNGLEAGFGAIWDEDPRYRRSGSGPIWGRVARAGTWTVFARRADGRLRPAYARGIGIVGNNFITNAWRVDSDSSVADALSRSGVGVISRFVSNLFDEFWPDIQRKILRR